MGGFRLTAITAAMGVLLGSPGGAIASGPSPTAPWYIDQYGGDPADVAALYAGRLGIIKSTAPRSMRFIAWRILHGQGVGAAAGEALSTPCCDKPWWQSQDSDGPFGWSQARALVIGQSNYVFVQTDRPGPNNTYTPNCFPDAFDTASRTLKDRIARYGAASSGVKAWLANQDAVFGACHDAAATLPPPPSDPSPWLAKDRAYQQAALDLYAGRNEAAAAAFAKIGRDANSPWRASGPYLTARALIRRALASGSDADYAAARAAVAALATAPTGYLGATEGRALTNEMDFHQHPKAYMAKLEQRLSTPEPYPQIAADFRDYTDLGETLPSRPDLLDWTDTIRAAPAPATTPQVFQGAEPVEHAMARYQIARTAALAHALDRWRAGRDVAWLLAAMSLAKVGDPQVPELLRAANEIPPGAPGWVTLQHHLIRLTLTSAPAAESRRRLDGLLAHDLSVTDRNVLMAERAQVAESLDDFVRFAVRRRICPDVGGENPREHPPTCVRGRWDSDEIQPSGIYDGPRAAGAVGLGEDARAIIDRAPLADRLALSRDRRLPSRLRLDIALTSYGRAVQLQDDAAIDALASELGRLLPLMANDFEAIPHARPGADKRFAEFVVLVKIPGVRTDLIDYVRPEGRRIEDYQDHWADWVILRRADPLQGPPPLVDYQQTGHGFESYVKGQWPDALTDLTCLGECGRGAEPLRLPDFIAARAARSAHERAFFFKTDHGWNEPEVTLPAGAVDVWDEMLAYCSAHPSDPRVPEVLHWLVHVGHFGGSHNHSGHRAFRLLHQRYPSSVWAKKTPYYND